MGNGKRTGEKYFTLIILAIGIFMLKEGIEIYRNSPGISSSGALPVFLSSLIIVFSFILFIKNRKENINSKEEKEENIIKFLFNTDVVVMVLLIFLYGIALLFGMKFLIITPIFLWVSMSFLEKGDYLKNLIYTIFLMIGIIVVFEYLFQVILP